MPFSSARVLDKGAVRILLITLVTIFVAEAAIMTVFAVVAYERHPWLEVIVDSSALTIVVAPLLYWMIVRPIRALAEARAKLLEHVLEIQEDERRRIARDLHDEIGQSFTSLLLRLRVLEGADNLDGLHTQAQELRELGSSVYDQIRRLARGLHPTVLDDLGLETGLQRLVEDFQTTYGTDVVLRISGLSRTRLDHKVESTVYRIVQESLTNCAKHSQATKIDVAVKVDGKSLLATIKDNGRGFDTAEVNRAENAQSFGHFGMRERALLMHGALQISSQPNRGTTVTLRIPLLIR